MSDANQKRARKPSPDAGFAKFRRTVLADPGLSLVKQERDGWPYAQPFAVLAQAGASLTLTPPDNGLVTLSYAGPVDLTFLMMGHAWSEGSNRFAADAVVVDFRRADLSITGPDLDAALVCLSGRHQERPRALLIQQEQLGMFKAFALRAAGALAVVQRCFFDHARAEAWAREAARAR